MNNEKWQNELEGIFKSQGMQKFNQIEKLIEDAINEWGSNVKTFSGSRNNTIELRALSNLDKTKYEFDHDFKGIVIENLTGRSTWDWNFYFVWTLSKVNGNNLHICYSYRTGFDFYAAKSDTDKDILDWDMEDAKEFNRAIDSLAEGKAKFEKDKIEVEKIVENNTVLFDVLNNCLKIYFNSMSKH